MEEVAAGDHDGEVIRLQVAAPCVAFGPGGIWCVAGQEEDVQMVNMQARKKLQRYRDHDCLVTRVSLAMDGEYALSGDEGGRILYWHLPTCKFKRLLKGHDDAVLALAFSRDSDQFAVSRQARTGRVLDPGPPGKEKRFAPGGLGGHLRGRLRDSSLIAAGGPKGWVGLWDLQSGACLQRFKTGKQPIAGVHFSVDGAHPQRCRGVAATAGDIPSHPHLWRWEVRTGKPKEGLPRLGQPTCIPKCHTWTTAGSAC